MDKNKTYREIPESFALLLYVHNSCYLTNSYYKTEALCFNLLKKNAVV